MEYYDYENNQPSKPKRRRIIDPNKFVKADIFSRVRENKDDSSEKQEENNGNNPARTNLRPRRRRINTEVEEFYRQNVDLYRRNTMKLKAVAKDFITINKEEDFLELHKIYYDKNYGLTGRKIFVLGEGSNTIFVNGEIDSVVVKINIAGYSVVRSDKDFVWVNCKAGMLFRDFVTLMCEKNYCGLENLSAIYGTVGAAPVQNIGAYGAEVKDYIDSVRYFDVFSGKFNVLSASECCFSYRNSIFKYQEGNKIISDVVFKLNKNFTFNDSYDAVRRIFGQTKKSEITPLLVAQKIKEMRDEKLPNPRIWGNCGSFFKNPVIEADHFEKLKNIYPDIVAFEDASGKKISAAWLIDKCGFKGKKLNGVGVYKKQPLVLVNYGVFSTKILIDYANDIIKQVKLRFGIDLVPEPHFVY